MDYNQAINFMDSLTNYEIKRNENYNENNYSVSVMSELAKKAKIHINNGRIFHVAGTNGKGTCAHAFYSLLLANNISCGLYTSPHITDIKERILLDDEKISEKDFASCVSYIKNSFDKMEKKPTYFDFLTAVAMRYFIIKKCKWIVLETGMGGRLDSTNVFNAEICAITSLGLDHTHKLGNTIEKIAFEKAGILKPEAPVILGKISENAKKIIFERAHELNCPVYEFGRDFTVENFQLNLKHGTKFNYKPGNISVKIKALDNGLKINIPVAIKAAEIAGFKIVNDFNAFHAPCRFEIIKSNPYAILSGAHNEQAAAMLVSTLKALFPKKKFHFVLGFLKGKNYKAFFEQIKNIAQKITVYKIQNQNDNLKEVYNWLKSLFPSARAANTPFELNERIKSPDCGVVIFTGSFYLCSQILKEKRLIFR